METAMKKMEDFLHGIRKKYYKSKGYDYDHVKKFWSRSRSVCCDAPTERKTLFKGKPLKEDFNKLSNHDKGLVTWREFCTNCKKQCETKSDFKT